jgi:hypothetical protein
MMLAVRQVSDGKVLGTFTFSGGQFAYPDKRVADIALAEVESWQEAGWDNQRIADTYAGEGWSNGYISIGKR